MAITKNTTPTPDTIEIAGSYDSGTATAGAATTLTDSGKSWTTDDHEFRIVWLTGGTGSGQRRMIKSNTATVLTVDRAWTTNPSTDTTYVIGYAPRDIVTALGSDSAAYIDAALKDQITISADAHVKVMSGGYFGCGQNPQIHFLDSFNGLITEKGSYMQFGNVSSDGYGFDGGSITMSIKYADATSGTKYSLYFDMAWYGNMWLYNTTIEGVTDFIYDASVAAQNRRIRINLGAQSSSTKDPQYWVDTTARLVTLCPNESDTFTRHRSLGAPTSMEKFSNATISEMRTTWFTVDGANAHNGADLTSVAISGDLTTTRPDKPIFLYRWDTAGTYGAYTGGIAHFINIAATNSSFTLLNKYYFDKVLGSQPNQQGYIYEHHRINIATGVDSTIVTIVDSTGAGAIRTAKAGTSPYAPTLAKTVTTDSSGNSSDVIVYRGRLEQNSTSGSDYAIKWSSGSPKYPYTFGYTKYGYYCQKKLSVTLAESSTNFQDVAVLTTNPYVVANAATAAAYTGISMNSGTKTITVSGTRTIQELYDYTQSWACTSSNYIDYGEPLTTADGVNFTLGTDWDIVVTGSLTGLSDRIVGTVTVSSGGVYEDLDGMKYETGGTVRYCKHIYRNVKAVTGGANQQYAVVACFDESGNDRTLNASRTAGGLTTDASGNVEAYYIYKIDSTTYTLTEYIGKYGYQWLTTPISSVTGVSVGSSGTYETNRLVTDSYVTLTEANALLVSGITANHTTSVIDGNANTYSQIQDNLKARQATTSEIETGKKGYISYYQEGLLISYDGSFYTLSSGWIIEDTTFGGTLKDSILRLSTPGTYNILLNSAQVNFEGTGTYDLRGATITTDITVDTITNATVTVQFSPGTSVTNNDPTNITVESSTAVTITVNSVVAGSRIQIYDTDNTTELFNEIVAGTSFSDTFTYTVDTDIRIRLMYVTASAARKWWTTTGTITSSGFTVTASQEVNSVYATNNVDGSSVTECAINANNVDIQVDDPNNTTTAQRIYNWYQYYLFTEAGIRNSDNLITATDSTHYVFDNSVQIKNMDTVNPLNITGANIVPTSGASTDIFDLSNGASMAINFERVEGFAYSSGSGLSAGQAAQLTAIENKTANIVDNKNVATQLDVWIGPQV